MWLIGLAIGIGVAVYAIIRVAQWLNIAGDQPNEDETE